MKCRFALLSLIPLLTGCVFQIPSFESELSYGFETSAMRIAVSVDIGLKTNKKQNLESSFEIYVGHDFQSETALSSLLDLDHTYAIRVYAENEDKTINAFEYFSALNDFPNFDVWGTSYSSEPGVYDMINVSYKNHCNLQVDFTRAFSKEVSKGWVRFSLVCLNKNDSSFVDQITVDTLTTYLPYFTLRFEIKDNNQIEFSVDYEHSFSN